jgi:hypothetical protein
MISYNCALQYAAMGWHVFPLVGKLPLKGSRGLLDATTDPKQIKEWFYRNPHYNIGIRTGPESNLTVIDIDCHGEISGFDSLRRLELEYGRIITRSVRTAGGGRHLYFNYLKGSTNRAGIQPGIDVRSAGGYVVAPFSMSPEGKMYIWENNFDIVDVPDWLIDLILRPDVLQPADSSDELDYIPIGKRNTLLFKVLCGLRYHGIPIRTARKIAKIFAEDCEGELPEDEIEATVTNVYKRYQVGVFNKRGSR